MIVSLTGETEEPDYERFKELMTFWETIPQGFHASWHQARETASTLHVGERRLTTIVDIVSKARWNEKKDFWFFDALLCKILSGHFGSEMDLQNLRCIFAQLLGLAKPPPMTNMAEDVWKSEYVPKISVGETRLGYELAVRILELPSMAKGPIGSNDIFRVQVLDRYKNFMTYLEGEVYKSWRQKWVTDFPELLFYYIDDGMTGVSKEEMDEYRHLKLERLKMLLGL